MSSAKGGLQLKIHKPVVDIIVRTLEAIFANPESSSSSAHLLIDREMKRNQKWGSRDRRFFSETCYDLVRWKRFYEASLIHSGAPISVSGQLTPIVILYLFNKHQEWPSWLEDSSLVDPIKKAAELLKSTTPTARFSRAERHSIPDWLDAYGASMFCDRWEVILTALNRTAPVDLRVSEHLISVEKLKSMLSAEGIETDLIQGVSQGLTLKERRNLSASRAFQQGLFSVQDRSSQAVGLFLAPQSGDKIIDACAGAGGKSLHLASLMRNQGQILAMDIHQRKLDELQRRAQLQKLNIIKTRLISGPDVIQEYKGWADCVLLDVPCSGSGVLRRMPETKWRLSAQGLQGLQQLQFEILQSYSQMVRPGGALVYSTCSFFKTENEEVVQRFLDQSESSDSDTGLENRKSKWSLVKKIDIIPDEKEGDGFFMLKLQRESS